MLTTISMKMVFKAVWAVDRGGWKSSLVYILVYHQRIKKNFPMLGQPTDLTSAFVAYLTFYHPLIPG
jgi:hypothetical protein